ncbi:MAG: hypothetical protein HY815_11330 [Candidatus Riflebacteria bacterium]|nr:hypothetical protein [Candidatus Riflebacteria bacterium]
MIRLFAWTLVLLVVALVPSHAVVGAPNTTPPRDSVSSQPYEAPWLPYFGSNSCVYLAVRDPNVEGPLVQKAMNPDNLSKADEVAAKKPEFEEIHKLLKEFVEEAKKQKFIEKSFTELFPTGLGMAVGPTGSAPDLGALVVVPKTDRLMKFYEFAVAHMKKVKGADSLKAISVEGTGGYVLTKLDKIKPVVLVGDRVIGSPPTRPCSPSWSRRRCSTR